MKEVRLLALELVVTCAVFRALPVASMAALASSRRLQEHRVLQTYRIGLGFVGWRQLVWECEALKIGWEVVLMLEICLAGSNCS